MPGLVVLNVSFNKLQKLPADMGQQLPVLQQLYLANNFLTGLPDSLAELELRDLFVSENELQAVPKVGYSSCCGQHQRCSMAGATCIQQILDWCSVLVVYLYADQVVVMHMQVLSECTALVKLSLAACQLSGPCQELAGMSQLRCAVPATHMVAGWMLPVSTEQ